MAVEHRSAVVLYNAVGLAAHGGELTVLTVAPGDAPQRSQQHASHGHEEALEDFVWRHVPANRSYLPRVVLQVAAGPPAGAILAAADRQQADLIVIGTRGRGRLIEAIIGSVAREVLRGARTAVMIVPPSDTELVSLEVSRPVFHVGRVLVPIELGRENDQQMRVATRLRSVGRWPIRLLHVRGNQEPEMQQADVDRLVDRYGLPDDTEAQEVGAPSVAAGICEAARGTETGLIVMGLEREHKRMAPGSIAYEVIRNTDAVVVAVPRAGA